MINGLEREIHGIGGPGIPVDVLSLVVRYTFEENAKLTVNRGVSDTLAPPLIIYLRAFLDIGRNN